MSFGAKKEKSKSTSVSTPTNPTWVTNSLQGYTSGLDQLGKTNPYEYVAGTNPLLQQAQKAAMGLNVGGGTGVLGSQASTKGSSDGREVLPGYVGPENDVSTYSSQGSPDWFNIAGGLGLAAGMGGPSYTDADWSVSPTQMGAVGSASARTFNQADLAPILNTYLGDVVDTSLADFDQGVARAQSEQSRLAAMNGGARNGNNAVASALLASEAQRGRASTAADLRYGAYDRAAQILGQDNDRLANVGIANAGYATQGAIAQGNIDAARANQEAQLRAQLGMFNAGQRDSAYDRMLTAGSLLGNLGTAQGQDQRANIGLLSDLGNQQYQMDQTYAQAPLALQALLGQLYGSAQLGLFNGNNTSTTGSNTSVGISGGMSDITKLIAALPTSDIRAKEDIEPIGQGPGGLPAYEFAYRGDPSGERFVGPMAQDVAQVYPGAVAMGDDGLMRVDYNALGYPTPAEQSALRRPPTTWRKGFFGGSKG